MVAGLAEVGESAAGAAEAVVRTGLLVTVAGLAGRIEGGGVLAAGFGGTPGGEECLTQAVERVRLDLPVTELAAHVEGPLKAVDGLLVAALPQVDLAEVGQRERLVAAVAALREQGAGLVQMIGGLLVIALPDLGETEVGQTACHYDTPQCGGGLVLAKLVRAWTTLTSGKPVHCAGTPARAIQAHKEKPQCQALP